MTQLKAFSNEARLRVLAVDSTSMGTQLLVDALGRNEQFEMIECPPDAQSVLLLIQKKKPEVAVISAHFEEPNSASAGLVRNVRIESPRTRVIVLIDFSEPSTVTAAFQAGAQGVRACSPPVKLMSSAA